VVVYVILGDLPVYRLCMQTSCTTVICTLALLCMCGFLLYGTIDQSVSAVGD
jgi:hypothetical protein